jgi:hypothetical protein
MALAGIQASFVTAEGVDKKKYTSLPDIVCFLEIPADKANQGKVWNDGQKTRKSQDTSLT